jgi:8-oxo-dGTP pyrophosphatase MutT (NUDIX family)
MYKNKIVCLNCEIKGHTFKNCKEPIKSYGLIPYRYTETDSVEFLLIQRKDTLGKTDFMRGKYKKNGVIDYSKLKCLIEEMTDKEKIEIITINKEKVWDNMWLDQKAGIFKNEKKKAMNTIEEIDYRRLLKESMPSRYKTNEWGFPKGRKNLNEDPISCAKREFKEETGISEEYIKVNHLLKFVEEFTASDGIQYKHIYYLVCIAKEVNLKMIIKSDIFKQEVKDIGFFDYNTSYKMFRDYDTQKKYVLSKAYNYLKKIKYAII